jgi:hypothetical protein
MRLAESQQQPADAPLCSDTTKLYSHLSGKPGGWGPAQDKALVRGIFKAG